LEKYTDIKYEEINETALAKKLKNWALKYPREPIKPILPTRFIKILSAKIIQPTFVIHHPYGFQPWLK